MPTGGSDRSPRGRAWAVRAIAVAAVAAAGYAAYAAHVASCVWRDLHPPRRVAPPLGGRAALAGFEEVEFRSADGVPLAGWWHPSRDGAAVLLAHGAGGNREQLLAQALPLVRAGLGVLLFDLRAHGRSGGACATLGDRERLDVAAALDLVLSRPGVAPDRVGAVGFSVGALAVAGVAIDDPRIAAVVLEAMQPTLERDLRQDYAAHGLLSELPAIWTARALGIRPDPVRPGERLCQLAPRPLLLVYGALDATAPVEVGERLRASACGPARLVVVAGGRHGVWTAADDAQIDPELVGFLARALAPDGPDGPDRAVARAARRRPWEGTLPSVKGMPSMPRGATEKGRRDAPR